MDELISRPALARVCNAGARLLLHHYDALGNLIHDEREQIDAIEWTVAGKVKSVTRTTGSTREPLGFGYGASGQRIMKEVGVNPGTGYREHYIRDAQGNIMATYRYTNTGSASLKLGDRPVYGSSRLGTYGQEVELHSLQNWDPADPVLMDEVALHYELTDHLGNVCAVVTGRLMDGNGGGTLKQSELVSAQGYEAFGSLLPGRNYSSSSYRFAFNGMEKDDELHGASGTGYTTEFRAFDSRVGRWWSIDPAFRTFPWQSPYAAFDNNPILKSDPKGDAASAGDPPSDAIRQSTQAKFALKHPVATAQIGFGAVDDKLVGSDLNTTAARLSINSKVPFSTSQGRVGEGDHRNAMRHTIWQALITQKFGSEIAADAGYAHEGNWEPQLDDPMGPVNGFKTSLEADVFCDYRNNHLGQMLGLSNPDATPKEMAIAALNYFHANGLYVSVETSTGNGPILFVPTKIVLDEETYQASMKALMSIDDNGYGPKGQQHLKEAQSRTNAMNRAMWVR